MAASSEPLATPIVTTDKVVMADEAEQRRVYDQRVPTWPLAVARLAMALLWFQQLGWKLPPDWGKSGNGGGLWFWINQEDKYPLSKLAAQSGGLAGIFSGPLGLYHDFIHNFAIPNFLLIGGLTFALEVTITVLLFFGLLGRFAGFLATVQAINLLVGLWAVPGEWYWTYGMLITISAVLMLTGPGRVFGLDQLLRPRLRAAIAGGNRLARFIYFLT